LIAVIDTGEYPAARLRHLTWKDVEFVMVAGRVQLTSDGVRNRLPHLLRQGLERFDVEGITRWIRVPIDALLRETEEVLGKGNTRLSGREVTCHRSPEAASRPVESVSDWRG
jgi:hypothetical protein